MKARLRRPSLVSFLPLLAFCACLALSFQTYKLRQGWPGLPPAPEKSAALIYGFGDRELSYRNIGLMLQNAGDEGDRITNIRDYNYANLEQWLWVTYALNSQANYVPSLAAFYFGATPKPEELRHLVGYLTAVGSNLQGEHWRWMAQAVYFLRFKIQDQPAALELARKLAALPINDPPVWVKQMPAFVMAKVGEKKAARDLMLVIAATTPNLQPADINQTCWYIDERLREPGDGLETNESYKILCAPWHKIVAKQKGGK